MRIAVAGGAAVKLQAPVLRQTVRAGLVAGQACDLNVCAAQRKSCFRMIETLLPVCRVVALDAVAAQLAAVLVFVTASAAG